MPRRLALALLVSVAAGGCALLGFGPPTGIVEGWVQQSPSFIAASYAEVCAFGADTVCIRAGRDGHYRIRLSGQTVWMRFRFGNQHPHRTDPFSVIIAGRVEASCALADRLVVSPDPIPCLPVRRS